MMMTSAENLAVFQSLSDLTGEMREAAQASEWDRLAGLERRCAALVAQLEAAEPVRLPPDMQRRKIELSHKILADDAAIREYTEPWIRQVQALLGTASRSRCVRQAYESGAWNI
jgi:flagellar protein FliT